MPRYNYRQHQRQKRRAKEGRSSIGARAKALWGTVLVALILVLSLGVAVPSSWTAVGLTPLNGDDFRLGLDLQGGTHLVYEADMSQIPVTERPDALEGVRDVIERRVNAFGVSEPVVQTITSGKTHRVIVELAGILDVNDAIKQIGETPILEFKEPGESTDDLSTDQVDLLEQAQEEDRKVVQEALDQVLATRSFGDLQTEELLRIAPENRFQGELAQAILDNRAYVGGFVPKVVETETDLSIVRYDASSSDTQWQLSQILICTEGKFGCTDPIPSIDATLRLSNIRNDLTPENFAQMSVDNSNDLGVVHFEGDLGWVVPGELMPAAELAVRELEINGISEVIETNLGFHIFLKHAEKRIATYDITRAVFALTQPSDIDPYAGRWKNTNLSGKQLKQAAVEFDQNTGTPYVALRFDSDGDKLFGELTAAHVGEQIAIFLDGEVISAPTVQQAIYGGQAIITGGFSVDEAKILAQRLNAGALPVPIDLISQQTVGPTLGSVSLDRSLAAGMIGFILVAIFMVLYYRLPGFLSVIALIVYGLLNLSAYKMFGVTITLAGIAGLVLSLGMAVDANVLIFERMKEELQSGRGLASSVEEGFRRAWTSIRDGNVTTLLAALVLFWFSSSFVKGFAVTLAIGVILSMFSAIVITRTFLRLSTSIPFLKNEWLYGIKKSKPDSESEEV